MSDFGVNQLFADGGVIGKNPSMTGGTMAFRHVVDGVAVNQHSQILPYDDAAMKTGVTNNVTEMFAIILGFESPPDDWEGTVLSDSKVTLGRLFKGWKWNNVPLWIHRRFQTQRQRLVNYEKFAHVQLDGHPTKAQLQAGIGKRGNPVSEHNVWCDRACKSEARAYMRLLEGDLR